MPRVLGPAARTRAAGPWVLRSSRPWRRSSARAGTSGASGPIRCLTSCSRPCSPRAIGRRASVTRSRGVSSSSATSPRGTGRPISPTPRDWPRPTISPRTAPPACSTSSWRAFGRHPWASWWPVTVGHRRWACSAGRPSPMPICGRVPPPSRTCGSRPAPTAWGWGGSPSSIPPTWPTSSASPRAW